MTARIYVGTYEKYNNGSIKGAWLELDTYFDLETFYKACAELHKDEVDPEYMFQDFEGFPERFYSESGADANLFNWLALDEQERDLLEAFIECFGDTDASLETAQDAFYGSFDSDLDLAYDYIESTGMLHGHASIECYFDYEKFTRDLMFDFSEYNGFYFSNNY